MINYSYGKYALVLLLLGQAYAADEIARGEHRIEVQNYGRRDPEIPISIMQAHYYDDHHDAYMIRIEDLNQTLNREINQDINREYNEWFEAQFNRNVIDADRSLL